jgi:hypothetical protein
MKKFLTLLFVALAAITVLQSCSKEDEQPDKVVLASIIPYWNEVGFACQLDNGETLYPSRVRGSYKVNQDIVQRGLIYFKELSTPIQGFTYNADVFNIVEITTKEIEQLKDSTQIDTNTDPLQIDGMSFGGGYLNVDYTAKVDHYATDKELTINLVDNRINGKPEYEDYYPLELQFKHTPKVGANRGTKTAFTACFYLGTMSPKYLKCKGYKIIYKDLNSEDEDDNLRSMTIDFTE